MSKNDDDESSVTLSIRLIRSCEHRNLRFIPLHHVDLTWTTEELMNVIRDNIQNSPNLPPPFKKFEFDTLKVNKIFYIICYHFAPFHFPNFSKVFGKTENINMIFTD